jgi:hyperosmotically inducible periplasmic protein
MNAQLKTTGRYFGFGLLASLVIGGQALAEKPMVESPSDGWITTKTKLGLVVEGNVPSTAVHVDTVDGVVTLHGKVTTEDARQKAQQVAKDVKGVRQVKNLLQVVPEDRAKAVEVSDKSISASLEKQMSADPALKSSSIKVKSVDRGVVYLTGQADSLSDYWRSVHTASATQGVRQVSSSVKVKNEYAPETYAPSAANDGTKSSMPDSLITARVKMGLMATPEVPAMAINVDTRGGVVTLFGNVPSAEVKGMAESVARKVDSVSSVESELQIVPSAREEMVDRADDVISKELKKMLGARPELKKVDVEVKNGVARLTGSVKNDYDRLNAVTIARVTTGVRSVKDDIGK